MHCVSPRLISLVRDNVGVLSRGNEIKMPRISQDQYSQTCAMAGTINLIIDEIMVRVLG